ncbi:MAG: hypothetical protein M3N31_01510 [Actinomycetota bacterium]|nr:hypothetical protein [Actinomycetota bacterium]
MKAGRKLSMLLAAALGVAALGVATPVRGADPFTLVPQLAGIAGQPLAFTGTGCHDTTAGTVTVQLRRGGADVGSPATVTPTLVGGVTATYTGTITVPATAPTAADYSAVADCSIEGVADATFSPITIVNPNVVSAASGGGTPPPSAPIGGFGDIGFADAAIPIDATPTFTG